MASRTSYMTNAIEGLFGHAAARAVASHEKLREGTLRSGCKMVTHESQSKGNEKPFRWMFMRRAPWHEVEIAARGVAQTMKIEVNEQDLTAAQESGGIWHFVICDFGRGRGSKRQVVTCFFASAFELVTGAARDKFDLLDTEDDPRLIETAMQDDDFKALLKAYFALGDTKNPRFYKTLASLDCLNRMTLLSLCCENSLPQCVQLVLDKFSVCTAPEPWLQLADPFWTDMRWGNTAFTIAAYKGDAETLRILLDWAVKHNRRGDAERVKDKRGQSLYDIVEGRLKKPADVQQRSAMVKTWNVLADIFGRVSPREDGNVHQTASSGKTTCLIIDGSNGDRTMFPLEERLTVKALCGCISRCGVSLTGCAVLVTRASIIDDVDTCDDAAYELFDVLRTCKRICLKDCSGNPVVSTVLLRAATAVVRSTLGTAWQSLDIVLQWTHIPVAPSAELDKFADALEDALLAFVDKSCTSDFHRFDMPTGKGVYVPPSRRHLIAIASLAFVMPALAHTLVADGFRGRRLRSVMHDNFKAHNPLLAGPAYLERCLLDKVKMRDARSVAEVLSATPWQDLVQGMIHVWVKQSQTLDVWLQAPPTKDKSGEDDAGMLALEVKSTLMRMVDGALVCFLKMRARGDRPGIDICPVVERALGGSDIAAFPAAHAYLRRLQVHLQLKASSDTDAHAPVAPRTIVDTTVPDDSSDTDADAPVVPHTIVDTAPDDRITPKQHNVEGECAAAASSLKRDTLLLLTFKGSTNELKDALLTRPSSCEELEDRLSLMDANGCRVQPGWGCNAFILVMPQDVERTREYFDRVPTHERPPHRRNQVMMDEGLEGPLMRFLTQLPCRRRPKRSSMIDIKGDRLSEDTQSDGNLTAGSVAKSGRPWRPASSKVLPGILEIADRVVIKNTFVDVKDEQRSEASAVTKSTGERLGINPRMYPLR